MNYLLRTAPHPEPWCEESLERSGEILIKPRADVPSIATRTRRRSLPRVRAPMSVRRRTGRLPGPGSRASAGNGVGPIASGASRGIAILTGR